jgi:inorganic pyrophosphatase
MIAIAITDPWAAILNDVTDLETKLPGTVDAIREWFRTYKIPDGKPENKFGLVRIISMCTFMITIVFGQFMRTVF